MFGSIFLIFNKMEVVKKMLVDLKMLIGLILQTVKNMREKTIIMLECYKITQISNMKFFI